MRLCVFGKSRYGIELRNGFGSGKEFRRTLPELRDELIVKRLLERLRPFARGENAVFELLQFRRNEALGIFEGLLSLVADGHPIRSGL